LTDPTQGARPPREKVRADIRADLIKRLFAVAISVGAATATVLSWDGYLLSINDRPLGNFWRFAIDIALVFIYMFLLMTSYHLTWWLFIHALIYALYIIWDLLTVYEHLPKYYYAAPAGTQTVARVYLGGLHDSPDVSRGPIITIGWGIYFFILYAINVQGLENRVFGTTIFAVAGLILYRIDKEVRYTMCRRAAWIVILLLASAAYIKWGPTDARIWTWAGPYIGSASCAQ
jgi:hypothetical protein